MNKQYYVVYEGRNDGWWYKTVYWVICVTENLEVATDLCNKFGYSYSVETVGSERNTPDWVQSREPKKEY